MSKPILPILCLMLLSISQQSLLAEHQIITETTTRQLLYRSDAAQRIILVVFSDASINRPRISIPFNKYRQRGDYQSSSWQQRITGQLAEQYRLTQITGWPISELGMYCAVFMISDATQTKQILHQLNKDKRIDLAQHMRFYQTQSHYSDPYYALQSHIQNWQVADLHQYSTGKDVTIALIDTGVDDKHPDLAGQVIDVHNFAAEFSPAFNNDIHGTGLAGVMVARTDNATGIVGIAPDARLIALKACWPVSEGAIQAACNSFTLALAINSAIKRNAQILNLSLSGAHDPLIEKLLVTAINKNIIVVAATPENAATDNNFPGSISGVISVSQSEQMQRQTDQQNIEAPGEEILTTMPNAGYDFLSGSSLSAAHISAISALLLAYNPDNSPKQIKQILQSTELNNLLTVFKKPMPTLIN